MQEFNEGDLVEAVNGDTVLRGRVAEVRFARDGVRFAEVVGYYGAPQWTLTVIEKAAPKLPTEPGTYRTGNGELWSLDSDGEFKSNHRSVYLAPDGNDDRRQLESVAPFTRLEPVPVTAKKVLDAIRQRIGSIDSAHDFQAVATQFGVTL